MKWWRAAKLRWATLAIMDSVTRKVGSMSRHCRKNKHNVTNNYSTSHPNPFWKLHHQTMCLFLIKMSNFPPSESPERPSLSRRRGWVEAFDSHTVSGFWFWDTYKMLPVPTDRIPQLTTIVSLFILVLGRETPHASACLCDLHGDVRDKSWLITKDGSPYLNNVHGQQRFTARRTVFISSFSPHPATFGLYSFCQTVNFR